MADKEIEYIDIAKNKKAYHDYDVLDKLEAGIELRGTEIKSIRERQINLKDSFVLIRKNEAWVSNMHISPWGYGNIFNHDPLRRRRLLLHKNEILKLAEVTSQKGYSLIPLSIYIKGKHAKMRLGVCKGKKLHDKRSSLREKDIGRDMERDMKNIR